MNIDWTAIADDIEKAAEVARSPAMGALAALGGPAAEGVVGIIAGIATVSADLIKTAEGVSAAIASGDLDRIRAADAAIQAENATLADRIAAS